MRITTERRLERLECADAGEGVLFVVLETLPDDDATLPISAADVGRPMDADEWESVYCGEATNQ